MSAEKSPTDVFDEQPRSGAQIAAEGPSRTVLAELPARVATFLQAISDNDGIRTALAEGGFRLRHHREGFLLLYKACPPLPVPQNSLTDIAARKASATVSHWVRAHFSRLHTTLERLHPDRKALLDALRTPREGMELLALGTLLAGVDALAEVSDDGVLATLEERGFGAQLRTQLEEILRIARSAAEVDVGERQLNEQRAGRQREARIALYRWFVDWSTTARSLVRRKDWLASLGLSGRKRRRATGA